MSTGWTFLLLAGAAEIGYAALLKPTDGFTRLWPTVAFALCAGLSLWLLTKATQTVPVSTAYPVWVGIGAVGAVLVGVFFFGDSMSPAKLFFSTLLIASIVGLKYVS